MALEFEIPHKLIRHDCLEFNYAVMNWFKTRPEIKRHCWSGWLSSSIDTNSIYGLRWDNEQNRCMVNFYDDAFGMLFKMVWL